MSASSECLRPVRKKPLLFHISGSFCLKNQNEAEFSQISEISWKSVWTKNSKKAKNK